MFKGHLASDHTDIFIDSNGQIVSVPAYRVQQEDEKLNSEIIAAYSFDDIASIPSQHSESVTEAFAQQGLINRVPAIPNDSLSRKSSSSLLTGNNETIGS